MCRLLGIIANRPVDAQFSLERFQEYSEANPDGWGIGWYEKGRAQVYKEGGIRADESEQFREMRKKVMSKIILAHVRKGTGAPPVKENSHPFLDRNWIFAHNGQVDGDHLRSLLREERRKKIEGETDSEVYFHWLLQNIEECGEVEGGIRKAVGEVVGRYHTGLNFLLSDGRRLYAFRYADAPNAGYYSLYRLRRPADLSSRSEETGALIGIKQARGEEAVLVCSEGLTDEEWREVGLGNLLIVHPDLKTEEKRILQPRASG